MEKIVFKQYHKKLSKEAWLKSLLFGLAFGFSALFICSTVLWFVNAKLWWLSFIALFVVTGAVTPVFYFKKFKPSKKELARRIDDLGLEERVLTMHELENDDSVMARLQKKDTLRALEKFDASLLKFEIPTALVVVDCVSFFLGLLMTIIMLLSFFNYLPKPQDFMGELFEPEKVQYEVVYEIDGAGTFEGEAIQLVYEGESAQTIKVIPEEGWMFVEWSDGHGSPARSNVDVNVQSDLTFTAVLAEIDEGEDEDADESGEEADEAGDLPTEEQEGEGDNPGEPGDDPGPGDGAGGQYEPSNQVIDGETFYGDQVYDSAYEDMKEEVSQNEELSEEEKDIIGDYFDTIKK